MSPEWTPVRPFFYFNQYSYGKIVCRASRKVLDLFLGMISLNKHTAPPFFSSPMGGINHKHQVKFWVICDERAGSLEQRRVS